MDCAMKRELELARLDGETFDVLIVGGGATGLGAAVDSAARGYRTALIEAEDFAGATSSRSTKLVHGGVRYLQQGNVGLVREALRERANLRANAPHLVRELGFVIPAYRRYELPYYTLGLKAYDVLAGRTTFAKSRTISASQARRLIPALDAKRLHGAVTYADAQFDDARLAVTLARTASDRGAAIANYTRGVEFSYDGKRVAGMRALDRETGREFVVRARAVINATGIFVDALRSLDEPSARPLLTYSRGSHVVVGSASLGGASAALLVPKTVDGRVLFAVPWHEHVVIGTTDVETAGPELDPQPTGEEIRYILETVNRFLTVPILEANILARFAGLRPLVNRRASSTAKISREHVIDVSASGLVTITGGKWTTYRSMAEDVVTLAAQHSGLAPRRSPTAAMPLHGSTPYPSESDDLRVYGSDAAEIVALGASDPSLRARLHPQLPYIAAEVVYAVRSEMARTIDDVLSRRTRALFLNSEAARASASTVVALIAAELGRDARWQDEQLRNFATSRVPVAVRS